MTDNFSTGSLDVVLLISFLLWWVLQQKLYCQHQRSQTLIPPLLPSQQRILFTLLSPIHAVKDTMIIRVHSRHYEFSAPSVRHESEGQWQYIWQVACTSLWLILWENGGNRHGGTIVTIISSINYVPFLLDVIFLSCIILYRAACNADAV